MGRLARGAQQAEAGLLEQQVDVHDVHRHLAHEQHVVPLLAREVDPSESTAEHPPLPSRQVGDEGAGVVAEGDRVEGDECQDQQNQQDPSRSQQAGPRGARFVVYALRRRHGQFHTRGTAVGWANCGSRTRGRPTREP